MLGLFWRQFCALFLKNWIVLSKHRKINVLRCLILPIAYGSFLAAAQRFLNIVNGNGVGNPVPIVALKDRFDPSLNLVWADLTSGSSNPSASDVMAEVTAGFTTSQLNAVKMVSSPEEVLAACPQNYQLVSRCFAAVLFDRLPQSANSSDVSYTIRADLGLFRIDVVKHAGDFEKRILPLQWALDSAIIKLKTGVQVPTPLEWGYTQKTNAQQKTDIRLTYIRGIRSILSVALFVGSIGIAYQLPGAFNGERANGLTSHLKAMGLFDSARIISWHLSLSSAYLPAWLFLAFAWKYAIFARTSILLMLFVQILTGLSLASWSFFLAAPFGKSPVLGAVLSTIISILFAILALVYGPHIGTLGAFFYTLILPSGFYIFAIRNIGAFELLQKPGNLIHPDPSDKLRLLPVVLAAIISIFLWPWLATLLESRLYDARYPKNPIFSWKKRGKVGVEESPNQIDPDVAISMRNLEKKYSTSIFHSKRDSVTAIADLTLDIPKTGIFVLLGSNGAGKSTTLSIIGGLIGYTRGSVTFAGGLTRPPRGTLGIVPQKNVLFPELNCIQTLQVWGAVKRSSDVSADEDLHQLLRDCDLGDKILHNAGTLSGGQKRKLQLAIGLVGGSKLVLIDECTSGVDPLSRRALWRTLTSFRNERTIIFTTHFLDEADLLADYIAVLASPGKLVAQGSPVALKSTLGEGYSLQVNFGTVGDDEKVPMPATELLGSLQTVAPEASIISPSQNQAYYHLKTKDSTTVERVLRVLDDEKERYAISSYEVHGTSIEDIFLRLMIEETPENPERNIPIASSNNPRTLNLADGRQRSPLGQALTIFHKRLLVARRSWLSIILAIIIGVGGSTGPLFFMKGRVATCDLRFFDSVATSLFLPNYSFPPGPSFAKSSGPILTSPPNVTSFLGTAIGSLPVQNVLDNATLVNYVAQNYQSLSPGGISLDLQTNNSLVVWEGTLPGLVGPAMLNLLTNVQINRALNSAPNNPSIIKLTYDPFPIINGQVSNALKWVSFFGLSMAVFPAFFSIYVSRERRSSVQAMQFSNGLSNPVGLWLGHLMFDAIVVMILATLNIIIFGTISSQFHDFGLLWFILVLYGLASALLSYGISLFTPSPLAAFATAAGYQTITFLLYVLGYLLSLTYAPRAKANNIITAFHFATAWLSPIGSLLRATFISINLFSLVCSGHKHVSSASTIHLSRYGGPLLYLILTIPIFLAILVWYDSGSKRYSLSCRSRSRGTHTGDKNSDYSPKEDVASEAQAVTHSDDQLRVLHVTKSFSKTKVVDDVSLGVSTNTVFALLGPNGAGKTTLFNIIRGDIAPDSGDALVNGISAVHNPRAARVFLGVCPQFNAIDSQLTVRQHLRVYGRLKGLRRGEELDSNIEMLLHATSLDIYADRLASKLSNGNQRKLSLAIALIGNPAVILIDEFSTGIDAKMKRDMWATLRSVAAGKSVVITTHSMEEASALANKVGIIAKRILAVGTSDSLSARYPIYEVHFSCRNREDVIKAQELMARIPGSKMADDVATRFEVPIHEGGLSLAQLFHLLATQGNFFEYTVERGGLESVFLKVIRENNVTEEDGGRRAPWWRRW